MGSISDVQMRGMRNLTTGRFSEVHGLVTSYDPMTYLAKVTYQPEGIQSGWLPIETGHIGQGYGWVVGLQTGNGGTADGGAGGADAGAAAGGGAGSQQQGDQVIIRFQEGDFETGKIVQRVHSQQDTPPPCQSGEMIAWTKFKQDQSPGPDAAQQGQQNSTGQKIWWKNDGSIATEDGNGASRVMDGKGNYTVSSGNAKQQTTSIVHQILKDKPASSDNSGMGGIGSMLAGGNIGSMLGGLLGSGGGGAGGGASSSVPTLSNGSGTGIAALLQNLIKGIGSIGVSPPSSAGGGGGGSGGVIGMLSGLLGGGGGGLGGLLGGGMGGLGGLTSMLSGAMQQVLHYHKMDRQKGVKVSAFQEKHTTAWDMNGITHDTEKDIAATAKQNISETAQQKISNTAQQIVHNGKTNLNGNTNVSQILTVSQQTNSPIYTTASDERLKHEIKPPPPALDKIMALEIKEFLEDRIIFDEDGKQFSDPTIQTKMIGFIAQDVRKLLPEMVFGDENEEFLSVSENKIGVMLLQAFQEFVVETRRELAEINRRLES